MTWTVRYTEPAAKAIRKFDPEIKARVRAAIDALREDPHRRRLASVAGPILQTESTL